MKPDVITVWPRNTDYPLWRQFIHLNRERFNQIITVIHDSNGGDNYSDWIKGIMFADYVQFVEGVEPGPGQDWRDRAVNAGLLQSYNAEWIWFTEQDFYPKEGFWEFVDGAAETAEVIAAYQGPRMHPCCIFIRRGTLAKTGRDFGVIEGVGDHFCKIQRDLDGLGIKPTHIPERLYQHYNGMSQNWYLATIGQRPNYELRKFVDYLKQCLDLIGTNIPIHERFVQVAGAVIAKYGERD